MSFPSAIAIVLAANVLAFLAFGLDKKLAEAGSLRISENKLLLLALLGGSIGAVAAQQLFRHKTRKEPFRTQLYGIVLIQAIGLSIWLVRPDLFPAFAGAGNRYLQFEIESSAAEMPESEKE